MEEFLLRCLTFQM